MQSTALVGEIQEKHDGEPAEKHAGNVLSKRGCAGQLGTAYGQEVENQHQDDEERKNEDGRNRVELSLALLHDPYV